MELATTTVPGEIEGLKTGCDIWRVSDDEMVAEFALATDTTHVHQTRGDTNADSKRSDGWRFKPRDSGGNIQSGAHRSLCIILVRLGIAEYREYPVASEIRQKAIIESSDARAGRVVGVHDRAHIFRIKASGKGSRVDQIADHDRQMTALFSLVGRGWWLGTVRLAGVNDTRTAVAQSLDGLEEPFSIAEQDAELFEVAFRQLQAAHRYRWHAQ